MSVESQETIPTARCLVTPPYEYPSRSQQAADAAAALGEWFQVGFEIHDTATGRILVTSSSPQLEDAGATELLLREVARRGRPELIWEDEPLVILAIPLGMSGAGSLVATALLVTDRPRDEHRFELAALALGCTSEEMRAYAEAALPTPAVRLLAMAELAQRSLLGASREQALRHETNELSRQISSTYEEISLIYRLTQHLKISCSDEFICRVALEWLQEVVPAQGLAIQLVAPVDPDTPDASPATDSKLLTEGDFLGLDDGAFTRLINQLGMEVGTRPLVANGATARRLCGETSGIEQLIIVPLNEGDQLFGWLAAINHQSTENEFGTIEANLMSSVAALLAIHCCNTELYRQQAELLAGIVRALTSAIDAKDPYTCGHSDRVARVAVRLGQELGMDAATLKTLYLSGLLHDVGKIGISDAVLSKPGRLSAAEFEHIKTHPEIGYNILIDLKKLGPILPVVRHHHEAWNGSGYPHRLQQEEIPVLARIVAVADSFDAMGSDRPYRRGMDEEKLDEILRSGAGKQWDPEIIDAFFRARDEIREIVYRHSGNDPNVPPQWT